MIIFIVCIILCYYHMDVSGSVGAFLLLAVHIVCLFSVIPASDFPFSGDTN